MKVAVCDYDEKYLSSLLSYLTCKCVNDDFSSFTKVEELISANQNKQFAYTVISEEFYDELTDAIGVNNELMLKSMGKIIYLSASIDNLIRQDNSQVVYKYGPMDGLYRILTHRNTKASTSRKYAVYSPTHHELTEMYGLSMCQMLSENKKVLLIDTMHCPIVRRLIRSEPRGGIIDVIYKLENEKKEEIVDLIEEYDRVDVFPLSLNPTDMASVTRDEWGKLIDYIDALDYETYVFVVDDINQGFRQIIEYVDNCVLINKKGDYYKNTQEHMKEFICNAGTVTTPVELLMTANNLNEGCYQLEELLSGNLGRYVRAQKYG